MRGVALPDLQLGEWLVFDNMGAYTRAAGSTFNGYDTADIKTYYVDST
jgi:ornithine decarboxylase